MTTPVLSKVHTFAQDIAAVRAVQGTPAPKRATTPIPTVATPPASTKAPTPEATLPSTGGPKKRASLTEAPIKITASASRDASYDATIITDKKRNRMNVSAEVSGALASWWKEKVQGIKQNKKRTYSVPAADLRRGVIETATSHTGRAAAADHKEIVARLKAEQTKRQTDTAELPRIVAARASTARATSWETDDVNQSVTETQTPPAATPSTQSTDTKNLDSELATITHEALSTPKNTAQDTTAPTQIAAETPGIAAPAIEKPDIPVTTKTPLVASSFQFPKIAPVIPTTPPAVRETSSHLVSQLTEPVAPTKPATLAASTEAVEARKSMLREETPTTKPRSRITMPWHLLPYVAIGGFLVIALGGIGWLVLSSSRDVPSATITTLPTDGNMTLPNSTAGNTVSARMSAPNKNALYEAMSGAAGAGETFYIVTPMSFDTNLALTSDEILGYMNRQFSPDALSTIQEVQLGTYRENPVILLGTGNEANLRGHLFTWEETMSRDLAPWFGTAIQKSTSTSLTDFSDSQIGDTDVRVLRSDDGQEQIVYGFVTPNTVIITSNSTAFLNLSESYVGQ